MKLRLRRPRELALALRELARTRPRQAEEYLETHQEEWGLLAEADPHDAADILEAIGEEAAVDLISKLDDEEAAEVLEEMHTGAAAVVIEELPPETAVGPLAAMPVDEVADILGQLDAEGRERLLAEMDPAAAQEVTALLAYPPDSAGGLMTPEPAVLPIGISAGEAIEALRRLHEHLENLSYVYVVDDLERLQGVISFRELVFARPGTGLDEVMVPNPVAVRPESDREEVAELIQRYTLLALPVIDRTEVLLGIVTVDDVIEAVQTEATEDIAAMVGAGIEETMYTPVGGSVRYRLPWIMVNLAIAFVVAAVINAFEPVIDRLTVLAAYMPVIASVGGNGGAQSQAVIIRAMAVETIPVQWLRRVLLRELSIGLINGLVIAGLSASIATVLTGQVRIGLVIGLAAFGNMLLANLAGSGIPVLLKKLRQDPALASNIFLTMVTDLIGFGGFLAIATALL